jgi:hypothetical protein
MAIALIIAAGAGALAASTIGSRLAAPSHDGLESGRTTTPWAVPGYAGVPFGNLAVARNGTLYYVDLEYGQIGEISGGRQRIVLSSLSGSTNPNSSIPAVSGLFVTSRGLWFSAESSIYEMTFAGRQIIRVASGFGAVSLDVLGEGSTIYYTTNRAIYEENINGKPQRVAGGGGIGPGEWTNPGPALDAGESPVGLVALSPTEFDFTTGDNLLAVVRNGTLVEYRRPQLDFFNGEMTSSPSGAVYAICGWSMCRIDGSSFAPMFRIPTYADGTFVAPQAVAVAPDGDFFESFTSESAPEDVTGILQMSASGRLLRVLTARDQHVGG